MKRVTTQKLTVASAGIVTALNLPLPYFLQVFPSEDKGWRFSGEQGGRPLLFLSSEALGNGENNECC